MLNGNDIQLFYKLLDSLSTSLRELAVKYELLVVAGTRQTIDRERTDDAVVAMARELSTSFSTMTREFENLKVIAVASKDSDARLSTAVNSMMKTLETIDTRILAATRAAEAAAVVSKESKDVTLHVDGHMDDFVSQLSSLVTASTDIKKMCDAVDEMKKQIEPFKKLAALFSKPVALIVGIYVLFTTIVVIIEGCNQVKKLRNDDLPAVVIRATTNATGYVTNRRNGTEEDR